MRITIVYQYFQDHGAAGHSSLFEFARYLVSCGHDVTVIAGEVGYMAESLPPSRPWYRRLVSAETRDGMKILRTLSYVERDRSYLDRLMGFMTFAVSCPLALIRGPRPDVIFASSPPVFCVLSAWFVGRLRRVPFVIEVRDLWLDSAIQMGLVRSPVTIAVARALDHLLYRYSRRIVALTQGIRSRIVNLLGQDAAEKVVFVPAGIDVTMLHPDRMAGDAVRERHQWSGKHVVLYFGAMGEPHNLDVLLRAATRLRDRSDLVFALIGNGYRRTRLELESRRLGLANVVFLPPIAKKEACSYLNAADLGVVSLLDIDVFASAIPTKMLNYMACGKPVLCGVRGEARRIVEEAGAGVAFEPDDDEGLSRQITMLLGDRVRREDMAAKGVSYVMRNFAAADKQAMLEQLLRSTVQNGPKSDNVGGKRY